MDKIEYEVFSFRVASDPGRTVGKNFFFDAFPCPPGRSMSQDYFFWVINGNGRCIVVDTCFSSSTAQKRCRCMHRPIEAYLSDMGIDSNRVTDLILSHLHWDHAGNLDTFGRATIHVQADEMAFCTGPAMQHKAISKIYAAEGVQSIIVPLFDGRVNLIDGDAELFPGISVFKVPGHTPGSQVIRVSTRRGDLVLASDAVHFWANLHLRSPFPILDSFTQTLQSFVRIDSLTGGALDRIIPGHDPLVRRVFPTLHKHEGISCLHLDPLEDVEAVVAAQFAEEGAPR
jgi:glyoxylase-like metal-dependent hydrolase (beta-lactamase superfamily II)